MQSATKSFKRETKTHAYDIPNKNISLTINLLEVPLKELALNCWLA